MVESCVAQLIPDLTKPAVLRKPVAAVILICGSSRFVIRLSRFVKSCSSFMNIELPLDGTRMTVARPVSRAIFKSDYSLELFAAIGRADQFYATGLADLVPGCKVNYISGVLKRLAHAGLIERLPSEPGQLRDYYRRRPSPLWDFAATWLEALGAGSSGSVARLHPTG